MKLASYTINVILLPTFFPAKEERNTYLFCSLSLQNTTPFSLEDIITQSLLQKATPPQKLIIFFPTVFSGSPH